MVAATGLSSLGFSNSVGGLSTPNGVITAGSLYNESYLEQKYNYNDVKQSYEIGYQGNNAVLQTKVNKIVSYLEKGYEDKALQAYRELLSEMSSQNRYGNVSENQEQLKSMARQLIESQTGCDLEQLITSKTANSFERGFEINWNGDSLKEEDLLAEMCDIDNSSNMDGLKSAAGTVGKVALTAGATIGVGLALSACSFIAAPVAVVGGLIAGAATLLRK